MFLLGAVRLKCGLAVNHFRPCWNSVATSLEKVCGRGAPTTHLLRLACECKGIMFSLCVEKYSMIFFV